MGAPIYCADIVIGIFWSRFGSPTGAADSGTEEEIRRSIGMGKKVLLYFSDRPLPPSKLNKEEYNKIKKFKYEFKDKGLYWCYSTSREFKLYFRRHIAKMLSEYISNLGKELEPQALRVAIGIVQKGKKILMVCRRIPEGNLKWQFPAGIVKPECQPEERVLDEIKNETGISCKVTQFLGQRLHPDTKVESFYYYCEYLHGRASNKDKNENREVCWIDVDKVEQHVTSDLYEGVQKVLKNIRGNGK